MENSKEIEAAVSSLYAFMKAMNVWELKYHELYKQGGTSKYAAAAREEINEIYALFLTDRDRKLGQQSAVSAGFPPMFDPEREKVLQSEYVGKGKVLVTTQWAHPTVATMIQDRRYTMVFKSGKCLLDKREKYSKLDQKWSTVAL
jgi:NTF2 fold immunity protein